MKVVVQISRIIVGALFIFSGFVKLVDPIGSQYKFQEYFSASVLNMEFLIPYALPFAVLLIVAEILLGVMVLIGYKPKFTVWSLLILTLIFLFLTWYSAFYNKVTDCGCFGDAIKLTPWETFYKNVILIVLILLLLIRVEYIKPIFKGKIPKIITFLSLGIFLFIVQHVLTHLPIIDFRAYAIGKNLQEGMKYPEDGSIPPVHDFMLEDEQQDLAPALLEKEKVMLIAVYNLDKADKNGFPAIKELADKAIKKGYTVYGASASFTDDLLLVQKEYDLPFEFLFCDETTLKTMIRANPGVVILNKGTVTQKKNWVDADEIELK
ncbi:DoxX family membrane protein [Polaribacter batillariae]|uniref:DoxX family membrane protein n=1 Tax=Polaribacter batillariae TaxID=2808900 RepID=A0ABX7SWH5_9FLAO|nr:BT_3928 family protein [Polaribacter batillariae]QTD37184.1 DoxX family membrane protein [Polaribacter batillariae]